MEKQNYHGGPPSAQSPTPYSEKEPYDHQLPPAAWLAKPTTPLQYQPYNALYGAMSSQEVIIQPPQHTVLDVPIQPTYEPHYLAFSIFTLIFCCLPLAIPALVFSVKTRDANHAGNGTEAQRYSRKTRILAISSLCVGTVLIIILYTVYIVRCALHTIICR